MKKLPTSWDIGADIIAWTLDRHPSECHKGGMMQPWNLTSAQSQKKVFKEKLGPVTTLRAVEDWNSMKNDEEGGEERTRRMMMHFPPCNCPGNFDSEFVQHHIHQ